MYSRTNTTLNIPVTNVLQMLSRKALTYLGYDMGVSLLILNLSMAKIALNYLSMKRCQKEYHN